MEKKNSELEQKFFAAIVAGETDAVRQLVVEDPQLLSAFDYGCFGATPVTRALCHQDRRMVELLIELGADLDRGSDWWAGPWTPLQSAANSGDNETMEYLLSKGAKLDIHAAASLGRVDELARMLSESPDLVATRGGDGCMPLHFAGTTEAVDMLLAHGAEIDARCVDHYSTPVQYLANSRPEVARHLFARGAEPDIFSAALAGDLNVAMQLIEQQANVIHERIDQQRFPPGPDLDVHNILTFTVGAGATALHAAAHANNADLVGLLVEAGLDPDVRGGYDDAAPLHLAAWEDSADAATRLLDLGCDIDLHSGEIHNNTAAGWAIVGGSADVFELLIDRGASVLEFFERDAQAAVDGEFRKYKDVPQRNYERIQEKLTARKG